MPYIIIGTSWQQTHAKEAIRSFIPLGPSRYDQMIELDEEHQPSKMWTIDEGLQ